jgi:MFS family permease
MTAPDLQSRGRAGSLVDIRPLTESPAFARLFTGRAVAGIGGQLTLVAVGLNVYALSRSTFAVALTGVVALVPTILAGLYGGMIADAFDRRLVALGSALLSWGSTLALAVLSWTGTETLVSLYVLSAVTAVASTVLMATQSAIQPRLLGIHLLPAAAALGGISTGITVTVGPALAGVLIATVGFPWCYTIDAVLFVAALAGVLTLPPLPPEGVVDRPGLASLASGVRFLRSAPNVRMSFFVDIVAMTFGNPRVLLPAAAALVLGGGAVTVGILSAATAVGVLLSSVFSGRLGAVRRQGVAIERSIQVYGLCIAGFGVVLLLAGPGPHGAVDVAAIAASALLLAGAGGADNVSSIFRSTLLQAAAPDNVRGRLQGVFVVVVTGGPRIGDLYVGLLASTGLLWLPPALGGLLVVALVAVLVRRSRFRAYDAAAPTP